MDIEILKEFLSLVETCSFQETAAQMNISQSALTKHIRKLEEELDVSLFDRSTRNVTLNEFSREYYPYAKQIVRLYRDGNTALNVLKDRRQTNLRIAFTPALAHYGIVEMLSTFSRAHPEYPMQMIERPQVVELLKENQCDFAFASENNDIDNGFNQLIYMVDRLVVIVPNSHPLACKSQVTLEDIKDERFILHLNSMGKMHLDTKKFLELCKEKHIEPDIALQASYTSTIARMVEQEQGIAVLHRHRIPKDARNIAILELVPAVDSYIYALYRNNHRLPPSIRTFLSYLLEQINSTKTD